MTYAMSDLHGEYDKYKEMLKLIDFSDKDTMYINGDICDRGGESAKIYLDIMSRDNIFVIKGNHEVMAEEHLEYLLKEHHENGINILELFSERDLWLWFENGGDMTVISLLDESEENRLRILDFIKTLPYYRTVDVDGKHYIMVHGGLGDYQEDTKLEDIVPDDLVWSRPDFNGSYFADPNTYLIVGHTPTFLLRESEQEATIFYGTGNVTAIDCGCAYPEYLGRLGCLCLETGEEFYV